jgi:hypothetical protein
LTALALSATASVPAWRTGSGRDWLLAFAAAALNLPFFASLVLQCPGRHAGSVRWHDAFAVILLPYGLFALFYVAVRVAELGPPG